GAMQTNCATHHLSFCAPSLLYQSPPARPKPTTSRCKLRSSSGIEPRGPKSLDSPTVFQSARRAIRENPDTHPYLPWCAGTTKGDFFSYNCSLPTYEMCVQGVIAGNRGCCSPNPYYRGPEFVAPRAKRKRRL